MGSVSHVSVEAHYFVLGSDIAIVFSSIGNRVLLSVVLVVSDMLFMPVNCLYNFEVAVV